VHFCSLVESQLKHKEMIRKIRICINAEDFEKGSIQAIEIVC
jgi:hypothetical protein